MTGRSLGVFGLLLATVATVRAADREFFVAPEGDDANNDGLSWASPFKTIQRAVDEQKSGEYFVITVSNGTYNVTVPIQFVENGGVKLRSLTGDPKDVIIDGGGTSACLWSANTQSRNYLAGITFQNGYSTESGTASKSRYYAGGIYMNQRSFITNCVVRSCSHVISDGSDRVLGGGMYVYNQSTNDKSVDHWNVPSMIVDTLVENCSATVGGSKQTSTASSSSGGGVYVTCMQLVRVTVRGCSLTNAFENGTSLSGGGLTARNSVVSNCVIVGNSLVLSRSTEAGERGVGAGVYLYGESDDSATGKHSVLVDSVVADNVSSGSGAGVYLSSFGRMSRVAVTNNASVSAYGTGGMPSPGGAVVAVGSNVVIENCLVEGNDLLGANGFSCAGLTIRDSLGVTVRDTVIRRNIAANVGGLNICNSSSVSVTNCVIAENTCTNEIPVARVYANIEAAADGVVVADNVSKTGAVEIVDTFIVSNVNLRTASLINGSGAFYYIGGPGNKSGKTYYMSPFLLRNCLVAGNTETCARGWLLRFATSGVMTPVPGVERALVVDHCTFAHNLNKNSYDTFARFTTAAAASNVLIRASVFRENRYDGGTKLACFNANTGSGAYEGSKIEYTYADVTNAAFVVTDENHNLGPDAGDVGFANPENGDFALTSGSCLVDKGGPFADWMGNGRRRSPSRDLSGGYEIVSCGPYGVAVTRPNSHPRRYGEASDIGCCEWWSPSGLFFVVE